VANFLLTLTAISDRCSNVCPKLPRQPNLFRARLQPGCKASSFDVALQAAEKGLHCFCHSERSEESLFLFMGLNRREIPRFAQNDKMNYFSAACLAAGQFKINLTNSL
jgi:hypothetical protein